MINRFTPIHAFRFYCQKILPVVYDDSLSYYEVLSKFSKLLNTTVDTVNEHSEAINNIDQRVEHIEGELEQLPSEIEQEINNAFDEKLPALDGLTFRIVLGVTTKEEAVNAINAGKIVYFEKEGSNMRFFYTGRNVDEFDTNGYFTNFGLNQINEGVLVQYVTVDELFEYTGRVIHSYYMYNVYTVVYQRTAFSDITDAFTSGKVVQLNFGGNYYLCIDNGTGYYTFGGVTSDGRFIKVTAYDTGDWETLYINVEGAKLYVQDTEPSDLSGLWIDLDDETRSDVDAGTVEYTREAEYEVGTVGKALNELYQGGVSGFNIHTLDATESVADDDEIAIYSVEDDKHEKITFSDFVENIPEKGKAKDLVITLTSGSWLEDSQTVESDFFESNGYAYVISADPDSYVDYHTNMVYADNVEIDGEITFYCYSVPDTDLVVNILKIAKESGE